MKNREILQVLYELLGEYNSFHKKNEQKLYDFKVMLEKEEYGDFEEIEFLDEMPEVVGVTMDLNDLDMTDSPLLGLFKMIFGDLSEKGDKCNCSEYPNSECANSECEEEIEILDFEEHSNQSKSSYTEVEIDDNYVDVSMGDDDMEVSIMVAGLDNVEQSEAKKMIDKVYGEVLRTIDSKNN